MSVRQIQSCIKDILNINGEFKQDEWGSGRMKKLQSATSTLYNASLGKVMLKPDEELARCHICAYIAAERLTDKYGSTDDDGKEMLYYIDTIPMEPKKAKGMVELFKQNIFQTSPVKKFSWTPSPKKKMKNSAVKNDRFTSTHPDELRKQLFDSPTMLKHSNTKLDVTPNKQTTAEDSVNNESENRTPRRKLMFEEDLENDEAELSPNKKLKTSKINETQKSIFNDGDLTKTIHNEYTSNDIEDEDDKANAESNNSKMIKRRSHKRSNSKGANNSSVKTNIAPKLNFNLLKLGTSNLLTRKYCKITPESIIVLANMFELPQDVAYNILNQFMMLSSYLVCPWQLVCGLTIVCVKIVHNERRKKDPRLDFRILERMCLAMNTVDVEEILECIGIVDELVCGEEWYRKLKIEYNDFAGYQYEESLLNELGSMLQSNNILVNDDQYTNWELKIKQDLSLKQHSSSNDISN